MHRTTNCAERCKLPAILSTYIHLPRLLLLQLIGRIPNLDRPPRPPPPPLPPLPLAVRTSKARRTKKMGPCRMSGPSTGISHNGCRPAQCFATPFHLLDLFHQKLLEVKCNRKAGMYVLVRTYDAALNQLALSVFRSEKVSQQRPPRYSVLVYDSAMFHG